MATHKRIHDWVRTDVSFPNRRAIVRVDSRLDEKDASLAWSLEEAATDAGKIKDAETEIIRRIVDKYPDLFNCCVHFIGFDFSRCEWRVGISHPSLEAVKQGDQCPEIPSLDDELRVK